jgi:hypothetical protein
VVFLDLKKKVWLVKNIEIPVIEDVPMKDLDWFTDKMIEAEELEKKGKTGTKAEVEFETKWYEKVCEIGLGKTLDQIKDTGISRPDFRDLMAEVYVFLSTYGTIEKLEQLGSLGQETQKKDKKP